MEEVARNGGANRRNTRRQRTRFNSARLITIIILITALLRALVELASAIQTLLG